MKGNYNLLDLLYEMPTIKDRQSGYTRNIGGGIGQIAAGVVIENLPGVKSASHVCAATSKKSADCLVNVVFDNGRTAEYHIEVKDGSGTFDFKNELNSGLKEAAAFEKKIKRDHYIFLFPGDRDYSKVFVFKGKKSLQGADDLFPKAKVITFANVKKDSGARGAYSLNTTAAGKKGSYTHQTRIDKKQNTQIIIDGIMSLNQDGWREKYRELLASAFRLLGKPNPPTAAQILKAQHTFDADGNSAFESLKVSGRWYPYIIAVDKGKKRKAKNETVIKELVEEYWKIYSTAQSRIGSDIWQIGKTNEVTEQIDDSMEEAIVDSTADNSTEADTATDEIFKKALKSYREDPDTSKDTAFYRLVDPSKGQKFNVTLTNAGIDFKMFFYDNDQYNFLQQLGFNFDQPMKGMKDTRGRGRNGRSQNQAYRFCAYLIQKDPKHYSWATKSKVPSWARKRSQWKENGLGKIFGITVSKKLNRLQVAKDFVEAADAIGYISLNESSASRGEIILERWARLAGLL